MIGPMNALLSELESVILDKQNSKNSKSVDETQNTSGKSESHSSKPNLLEELKKERYNILHTDTISSFLDDNPNLEQTIETTIQSESDMFLEELSSHPFKEEEEKMHYCKSLQTEAFFQYALKDNLLEDLTEKYGYSINHTYYINKIKTLLSQTGKLSEKKAVVDNILERWQSSLDLKISSWYLHKIDEWREKLIHVLKDKIDEFNHNKKASASDYSVGRLWNLAAGKWQEKGINILNQYDNFLEKKPELREIAEMIGRNLHKSQRKSNQQQVQELSGNLQNRLAKEEYIGIHESSDLNNLVSAELGLLGDKTLETIFYLKLAEKRLLSFDLVGKSKNDIATKENTSENCGPVILCVDTSGSMNGSPEKIAKILTYAIVKIASTEQRRCYIVSFSTAIETIEITDFDDDISSLLEFLNHSFKGGTSFSSPIKEALKVLDEDKNYKNADILVISDFVIGSLDNQTLQRISKIKTMDVELHSLTISNSSNEQVLNEFTNHWCYQIESEPPLISLKSDGKKSISHRSG